MHRSRGFGRLELTIVMAAHNGSFIGFKER